MTETTSELERFLDFLGMLPLVVYLLVILVMVLSLILSPPHSRPLFSNRTKSQSGPTSLTRE